jgi:hypothetical protein
MASKQYRARVYAGDDIYLGVIVADNLTTLKRLASRKINGSYHKVYDTMQVMNTDTNQVSFVLKRNNKITPWNTCAYGAWNFAF